MVKTVKVEPSTEISYHQVGMFLQSRDDQVSRLLELIRLVVDPSSDVVEGQGSRGDPLCTGG